MPPLVRPAAAVPLLVSVPVMVTAAPGRLELTLIVRVTLLKSMLLTKVRFVLANVSFSTSAAGMKPGVFDHTSIVGVPTPPRDTVAG